MIQLADCLTFLMIYTSTQPIVHTDDETAVSGTKKINGPNQLFSESSLVYQKIDVDHQVRP